MQIYRNGVLINTLSLPFAPGRYTVSGLDPETSYMFAATVSNAVGRSRSPLYAPAVTTVGMSLCGTKIDYKIFEHFVERQLIINRHRNQYSWSAGLLMFSTDLHNLAISAFMDLA